MTKFLGSFEKIEDVVAWYSGGSNYHYDSDGKVRDEKTKKYIEELNALNLIVAAYSEGSYDGEAFALFKKGDEIYEVNDCHCSCNGLANWEPELTTKDALLKRSDSYGVWSEFKDELKEIIDAL